MELLPKDTLLSIIRYYQPIQYYRIYRISWYFRKLLYLYYSNKEKRKETENRSDLLWLILYNKESIEPRELLYGIFDVYCDWCSRPGYDYGYFRLLYNFNFTYSSDTEYVKKLYSILSKQNDLHLIKHLLPNNSGSILQILKFAIRDSRIEIFDHVYDKGLPTNEIFILMMYTLDLPYRNEMFTKILNLQKTLSVGDCVNYLSKLFEEKCTQFTQLILSKIGDQKLGGSDYYRLKRLVYKHIDYNQQKQVINIIREFCPFRLEINERVSINRSGKVVVSGKLEYKDILYILNKLQSKKPSKKYRNLDSLVFIKNQNLVIEVLELLQMEREEKQIDIKTVSSVDRYIIYKLCEFLNLRFKRIDIKSTKTLECRDFSSSGTKCGCKNVPAKIRKYENGLDWDDRFYQYEIPWTWKVGVSVYFTSSQ